MTSDTLTELNRVLEGLVATLQRINETPALARSTRVLVRSEKRDIPHGSKNAYDRYKCRCDQCRAANNAYQRAYQAKRRQAR